MNEVIKIPAKYISYMLARKCPNELDYREPSQWDSGCLLTKYENFMAFYYSLAKNEQSFYDNNNSTGTCAICWYRFLRRVENDIYKSVDVTK